jgi:hypothetical protein
MHVEALEKVVNLLEKKPEGTVLTDEEAGWLALLMLTAGKSFFVGRKRRGGKQSFTCEWELGSHMFDGFRGSDPKDVLKATAASATEYLKRKLADHTKIKDKKKKK